MQIDLSGQRALVTGANSGLGEAIAKRLGAAGAKVAVNFRSRPDDAEAVVEEIKRSGSDGFAVQADVTDYQAVDAMFEEVDKQWGGLDILVNNAGIDGEKEVIWEQDFEAFENILRINLFGAAYCARHALKRMIPAKSGVIINNTSVHELIPWVGQSAYCASKAGLSMLSKSLALEAASHGVRVLCIAPGAIQTDINQDVWKDPAMREDLMSKIPMNRMGRAEEIGDMVVVLASGQAGYMTGSSVYVDGGMINYPSFEKGG